MKRKPNLLNKILILGIIFLFFGAVVTPCINAYDRKTKIQSQKGTLNYDPLNDDFINSYWKFDECSGDVIGDSSIPHYNGTLHGASWVGGSGDCALYFDGVDDYINFSDYASEIMINNTDDIILTFMFKSTGEGVIFSSTASWGYNPEFRIELLSNGSLLFYTVMSFQGTVLYSDEGYNDDTYHFVEYYFNGISTSPTATVYIDYELVGSVTHFLHDFENIDFKKAKIGVNVDTLTDYYQGYLDDFKIIKYEKGNKQEPPAISGPAYGPPDEELEYIFVTDDPEGDKIYIKIDWGDGEITDWLGPHDSGEEAIYYHSWEDEGTYEIKAKSMDIWDDSRWSDGFEVIIGYYAFPKICCDPIGLNFGSANAGSTVNGQIIVSNCGDPESFLNWYVDTITLPTWGTWAFNPDSGEGIAEGDSITVDVECVLTDTEGEYSGNLTVINSDNPSDKCVVETSVIVPRTRSTYSMFYRLLEKFPILERLLGLNTLIWLLN